MLNDLERAKSDLIRGGYTCVLRKGDECCHSSLRGVRPLLDFLDSKRDFRGYCAADKVIGAGAAHLYVLLGVGAVWAAVMSEAAQAVLRENGVEVFAELVVPAIVNRAGDGICPIETAVTGITSPREALTVIRHTLERLRMTANN